MAFERKSAAAPATTKAATATSKKAGKESASVWINFTLCLETKAGTKKVSSGIPADSLFKKLFGEAFTDVLNDLEDAQIESITEKLSAQDFSINVVLPSEPSSFEDLF